MRVAERLVVVVLAAAVLVAGVLGLVEITRAATDREPWLPLDDWATSIRALDGWSDPSLRRLAVALCGLGAVLVAGALWPRRPELLVLVGSVEDRHVQLTRRGMETLVEEAVLGDPEIRTARVRIDRRQITITVGIAARTDPDAARTRVARTVAAQVDAAGVSATRAVTVSVSVSAVAGRVQ